MENNANVEMTGAENQENQTQDLSNNLDASQENQNSQETTQPTQAEIATAYLKEQGFEFETIEDLKRVPEKIIETKEVNPYEDILDDDDKAYLTYKKETGRGRKDFEALNSNLDELPRINLAREKVRKESGLTTLTDEQADEYLADTLGIDIEDMSGSDQIKLAQYTKSILEEKKAEQEKYRKPIENKPGNQNQEKNEYVRLPNGSVMLKSDLEILEKESQKTIEIAKEAVNSVAASAFEVVFDDNGTERKEVFSYDFDEKDKHSMLSNVSNIDAEILKDYGPKESFNHKQFGEDMFWRNKNNREKAIASIVHKAVAKNTEEILKQRGNVNYETHRTLEKQKIDGVVVKPIHEVFGLR
jgi:hypothetical protein